MERKINIACFKSGSRTAEVKDIWQWDYGQILRIQGLPLPTAVEIHFSLDEHGGEALRRIGMTNDGVTDVVIPDSMLKNESAYGDSYYFFAYIYLTDETSGNTEYKIRAKVSTRSKPEGFVSGGNDTFAEILKTVNEIAEDKVDIPVPAKVGQVLAVKATDESGKPTEFEATDPGGGVSDEKIAEAVGTYMEEHPIEEIDPTVPEWAKQPEKPSYTAEEVGADTAGTAESKVSVHNVAIDSHNDIRLLVQGLTERLNALADSDDTTLDQMSEVVAYIKSNKSLIDAITTSKVNVSDIIDNLVTNVSNKPLSAAQGVALKALIDAIAVPTKLSELENDSGYAKTTDIPDKLPNPQKLTFAGAIAAEYDGSGAVTVTIPESSGGSGVSDEKIAEAVGTYMETHPIEETDPTVPDWAKQPKKPTYTASEVGALPVGTKIPSKTSDLQNDSGFTALALDESLADNTKAAPADMVGKLKEDITHSKEAIKDLSDKKITKFYASNLGETTLNDSDNGKIQDMILYGKSLQDGTPTPDNPIEIQSVVNPVVKVRGKNLLDVSKATFQVGKAKLVDGEIYLNGTFDSNYDYYFFDTYNVALDLILKVNKTVTISCGSFNIGIRKESGSESGKSIKINPIADRLMSIFVIVPSGTYENVKVPIMVEIGDTVTDYEPYKEPQTASLPYTLNAIPVTEGGNVTIDSKQYIADYVDVERGKLVRMVDKHDLGAVDWNRDVYDGNYYFYSVTSGFKSKQGYFDCLCSQYRYVSYHSVKYNDMSLAVQNNNGNQYIVLKNDIYTDASSLKSSLNGVYVYFILETPTEIDLTDEEVQAFRDLATYYPTTNVFVTSDQLDGYTEFNYPVSLAEGWNYVKQQLGDTRDYIYDMDLQSAEAYVNSEYAVALAELEV